MQTSHPAALTPKMGVLLLPPAETSNWTGGQRAGGGEDRKDGAGCDCDYACVYTCEHLCTNVYVQVHTHACTCEHICIPGCASTCTCVCVWPWARTGASQGRRAADTDHLHDFFPMNTLPEGHRNPTTRVLLSNFHPDTLGERPFPVSFLSFSSLLHPFLPLFPHFSSPSLSFLLLCPVPSFLYFPPKSIRSPGLVDDCACLSCEPREKSLLLLSLLCFNLHRLCSEPPDRSMGPMATCVKDQGQQR